MPAVSEPRARFHDGRSAEARSVEVELGDDVLVIRAGVGTVLGVWAWPKVRVLSRQPHLRLAFGATAPRLTILDPSLEHGLRRRLPSPWPTRIRAGAGLAVATMVVAALGYAAIVLLPRRAVDWVPQAWMTTLGEATLRSLADGAPTCDGPGRDALAALAAGFAADGRSGASADAPLRLVVVDLRLPNAFALPGGIVVVTRGLIGRASSAEALVGVLAHEAGHVVLRHPDQAVVQALGVSGLLMLLGVGSGVQQAADVGALLASLRYGREQEREADAWAVRSLRAKGMAGAPTATLLEKLEAELGGGPTFLSTHPGAAERAALLRAVDGARPALDATAWAQVRALCKGARE